MDKNAPYPLITKSITIAAAKIFGVVLTAVLAADTADVVSDQYQGLKRNERCEAQLRPILEKDDLPFDGASRYNPLVRQCSYKYFKNGEINTIHWMPDLK